MTSVGMPRIAVVSGATVIDVRGFVARKKEKKGLKKIRLLSKLDS